MLPVPTLELMKKLFLFLLLMTTSSFALDFELVTNEPGLNELKATTIEERFLTLLNDTPAGADVYLNINGMRLPYIATSIVEAKLRGVNFHILMRPYKDEGSLQSYHILQPAFPGNDGSTLSICGILCSSTGFNHNKFMLFSRLNNGTENISIHTSSNFWDAERKNYNDFLIIKNHSALFDQLKDYFTHLKRGRFGTWNKSFSKEIDETISMYTFPSPSTRRTPGPRGRRVRVSRPNPILDTLNSIQCAPGSKIYLAHSLFSDDRLAEARKFKQLSEAGCDVKIFLKNDRGTDTINLPFGISIPVTKDSPGDQVKQILGNILTIFPFEEPIGNRPWREGDPKKNALHSKIMMIHAPVNGEGAKKLVMVGTHNLDGPSFKLNNELLLKIENDQVFDAYMESFLRLESEFEATYGSPE